MTLFPFFENIENKTFLVIGGGRVAEGKVKQLKHFTDNIIVIAKETDISEAAVITKSFEEKDLNSADYVIGATDDNALNERIYHLCTQKNIPVNIADNPEFCTFIFPSLIKKGNLTIGICTGGKSPAASKYIRKEIENILPENIDSIIEEMGILREKLKKAVPDQKIRSEILKNELIELIK